jgi:anti-sigma B factor antagonist
VTIQRLYYERELPSDLSVLAPLYGVLNRWTHAAGIGATGCSRISVAVSEAVTNVIIHAHKNAPDKTVYVAFGVDGDQLVVEIGDRGVFGWTPPMPPDVEHWEQPNGRGIHLIHNLAHSAEFLPRNGGGTLVRMTFQARETDSIENQTAAAAVNGGQGGNQMESLVETFNDVDVMRVSGRIDLVTSNTLKDMIREHLHRERRHLVLNLERVDFINSSGLGSLVSILKDVRLAGGSLVLSNLAPYVQEIFEITQLSNVFEIFDAELAAVESLTGRTEIVPVNP